MTKDAPRGVDDAALRSAADSAAAKNVGGRRGVKEDLVVSRLRNTVEVFGDLARDLIGDRDIRWNAGLARIRLACEGAAEGPQDLPFANKPCVVVGGLHGHYDGTGFGLAPGLDDAQEVDRVAEDIAEPLDRARQAGTSVGQGSAKEQHDVGALGEAYAFEVGLFVNLHLGGDGDTLAKVLAASRVDPQQRFRVGAHDVTDLPGEAGEAAPLLALHQEADCAEHPTGEDDLSSGGCAPLRRKETVRTAPREVVAALRQSLHQRHHGVGNDLSAGPFGQIEVILVEGVLGTRATPDHAAATESAAGAFRTLAVKVRIRDRDVGVAKVDPNRCVAKGLRFASPRRGTPEGLVGRSELWIFGHAEHPAGGVEVFGHHCPPVLEALPLGIIPHRLGGFEEGVGVDQATAPDADAVQNERLAK